MENVVDHHVNNTIIIKTTLLTTITILIITVMVSVVTVVVHQATNQMIVTRRSKVNCGVNRVKVIHMQGVFVENKIIQLIKQLVVVMKRKNTIGFVSQ